MYRLLISKRVIKFIDSLPTNQRQLVFHKFELLRTDPFTHPQLDIKKMKYSSLVYRLRVGKLRFIYEIDQDEIVIFVFTAGNRGDIYKKI